MFECLFGDNFLLFLLGAELCTDKIFFLLRLAVLLSLSMLLLIMFPPPTSSSSSSSSPLSPSPSSFSSYPSLYSTLLAP